MRVSGCSRQRDVIYRALYRLVCLEHTLSRAKYISKNSEYLLENSKDFRVDDSVVKWFRDISREIEGALDLVDFVKEELLDEDLPGVREGKIKFGDLT